MVGLTSSVGTRTSTSVVQWYPGDNGLFVSSGADGQLKVWDANVLSTPVETFALGKRIYCHHISGINPSCVAVGTETNHVRIGIRTQCLKIAKKVALNIASEASYVYILSGQNFIKTAQNWQFGESKVGRKCQNVYKSLWNKSKVRLLGVIFKHCDLKILLMRGIKHDFED